VARILEAIYETDFVEESYGFRPGQGPHRAIKALRAHVIAGKTSYVFAPVGRLTRDSKLAGHLSSS